MTERATFSGRGLVAFVRALARMLPRPAGAAVALSVGVTAAEAVSVLLLVLLLRAVGLDPGEDGMGGVGRAAEWVFGVAGTEPTLGAVLAGYVFVVAVQAGLQRAQIVVNQGIELQAAFVLRTRLFDAVARARWPYLTSVRTSDLLHGLTAETARVGHAAVYVVTMLSHLLLALVYLVLSLRVSLPVTMVALGTGAVLVAVMRGQRRTARRAGEDVTTATAEMVSAATEHVQAMKVVKSYGAEEREVDRFRATASAAVEMNMRAWRAFGDSRATFLAGSAALLAVVAYVSLEVLEVGTAAVLLLVFLFYRLVPRLGNIQGVYQGLVHHLPAYESVMGQIRALDAERETTGGAPRHEPLREGVRFEGVSFAYESGGGDAVRDVTLELAARRTTALVGPSGAGKTTVADLLLGLVRPRTGRVLVDGRPLAEGWLREWRDGIGYVAQETVLFHDTVRANLQWARPDATDEQLWEALRQSAAEEFVQALPEGLATVVGDRGVRLSGGERQRLALARALLRKPSILVLDEATSALDTENERRIRQAVRALHGQITIVLITHRLTSVRDADAIHVLESGRLVESGSWESLMARDGRFRQLWRSQGGDAFMEEPVESARG